MTLSLFCKTLSTPHPTSLLFSVAAIAAFALPQAALIGQEIKLPVLKPSENLKAEGIPEIPQNLIEKVRPYTESRSASMASWHPKNRSILISTRFANSNQIHRVAMPGGARYQVTFFNEPIGTADYEPKSGSYFLYTKDTGGNEFAQLYRYDVASGKSVLLSDGGRSQNGGWVWSRSKNRICFASTQRNGADRDLWIVNPYHPETSKLVFELSGGGWSVQDWSPDDAQVLIIERLSVNKSNLYLGDIATGKLTSITDPKSEVAYSNAVFSKDGKSIFLTTDEAGEFEQLAKMDLTTKKIEFLTQDIPWDVESTSLSNDRSKMAFSVNNAGLTDIYVLDLETKTRTKVDSLTIGVGSLGAWRSDDSEFAVTLTSSQSSSDVYSVNAKTLKLERWTESEMGGLNPSELATSKLIEWRSFDGKQISGFMFSPSVSQKSASGKKPVIINIHGGPEGQSRPVFLARNNYLINELGCVMIFPNVRGSTGYGKSFSKLDNGFSRLDSVRDIGSLLDWIGEQPDLDKDRIMVTGGSYGGYMTLACAVQYNDRIACSLDVVGISHFGTFLKNTESYRRDLRRVEYGDERDPEMAKFFEKIAPLNNAAKITKPLFIVQGGNDPRVPLSEADQMVEKVRANGGGVWYLMANDEGHGFRKKNNADFQFYATVLFIEKHLIGNSR